MQEPLIPARLEFRDGTPYSREFDDVYHSASGGPAQARHVFLGGNGLPGRWRDRERFVVFENGFGIGLNFLATWRAWRDDPARCRRLHYVSIEKHPFSLEDLRTLHSRFPEFEKEAAELHAHWPLLVPGGHRAELDDGSVVLTLFFADIRIVRDLRLAADAIFLDGFSPAKNPDMWGHATMRSLSRLCAPGATAATWSVAAGVRNPLESAGFTVEKRPGFGAKQEMLVARYAGSSTELPSLKRKNRHATVIGAGLAGAAVCERLCARGWEVTLHERRAAAAEEASGNHAGTFHPIVTPDDSVFARLTRAAFLCSLSKWKRLPRLRWDSCGVLQLARNDREDASQRAAIAGLGLPAGYAQYVGREVASAHAGVALGGGGLWFPEGGWIQPRSLVSQLLDACGTRLTRVFSNDIHALRDKGQAIVLATADDKLHPVPHARLRRVRGQVTHVPAAQIEAPHAVLLRGGFVLPPVDDLCVVGASFDIDDDDASVRESSHAGNLERLCQILPSQREIAVQGLGGRVGFRTVVQDRLPVVGRLEEDLYCALALGSRGLIWSSLAAELIASELDGEPLPLEGRLADALSPSRFALRSARRGG
jgi:tRNA 5-methylaminomethyl-2-thiouridine biosynthesis bifunctional protein